MRTVKWNPFLSGVCTVLGGLLLCGGAARADVSSTNPAAIVVYPKIVVDTTSAYPDRVIDTVIQLTNTASYPVNVRCFYVNANGHCADFPFNVCDPYSDPPTGPWALSSDPCPGSTNYCVPQWSETDFALRLTPNQPINWNASIGLDNLPLAPGCAGTCIGGPTPGAECSVHGNCGPGGLCSEECRGFGGPGGQFNQGRIPPVSENPFQGELKCVQVGDDELPIDQNDLKGEATIQDIAAGASSVSRVDIRGYNAIGIQAIEGQNNRDNTLVIGQEYNACPTNLLLDAFFDDAVEPSTSSNVRTKLTLVPCSEDFNLQAPITTTVQFLVFNEFEQRFSTSRSMSCFIEIALSDIDTRLGPTGDAQSIFNVQVQGTLTGQIVIRGVADNHTDHGHGLLGIAEEFHGDYRSAAFTTVHRGTRTQNDVIVLPAAQPTGP